MIPNFPDFTPLSFDDFGEITAALDENSPQLCELSFSTQYIWQDFDNAKLTKINGNLCMMLSSALEPPYFIQPIGKSLLSETISTMLENADSVQCMTSEFIAALNTTGYQINSQREEYDYIYRVNDLANMKGRRFDGKRNHIKQFARDNHKYTFEDLNSCDRNDVLAIFEAWWRGRGRSNGYPIELVYSSQRVAMERAMEGFDRLKLFGGALRIDSKLKGFTIASRLNKNTACLHFKYFDPEIKDIDSVITNETFKHTLRDFEFANLEQDLGIEGLRRSKLSYHPERLAEKFEIRRTTTD